MHFVPSGFAAVGRYALPNPASAQQYLAASRWPMALCVRDVEPDAPTPGLSRRIRRAFALAVGGYFRNLIDRDLLRPLPLP
jgi:hypothetical protein